MKRPWLAAVLTSVAATAILLLCFGVGLTPPQHRHDAASLELAAAVAPGRPSAAPSPSPGARPSASSITAPATTAAAPSGGHDGHGSGSVPTEVSAPVATSTRPVAPSAPPATASPDPSIGDPGTPAANRRQASLADAAGAALSPIGPAAAAAPPRQWWVTSDAAGVNSGSKKQAAGLTLRPADQVDPADLLPEHGLANGCAAGYGKGVVCLPQTPPSHAGHGSSQDMSLYWSGEEARTLLPAGIVLDMPGADRLGLDGNGDGIACGPGDR